MSGAEYLETRLDNFGCEMVKFWTGLMPCTGAVGPVFQLSFWTMKVLVSSVKMEVTQSSVHSLKDDVVFPDSKSARIPATEGQFIGLCNDGNIPLATTLNLVTAP